MKLNDIRKQLDESNADAWILVDYENRNPAVVNMLGNLMLTRKIFIVIPRVEKPYIIAHGIDCVYLNKKEITDQFDLKIYQTWQEMEMLEKQLFPNYKKVLMDISEAGLLPRVSLADYGSVKFINDLGITIESSMDILQNLTAVFSEESYTLQLKAENNALRIKDLAFKYIKDRVEKDGKVSEYEVQQFICKNFDESDMVYDEAPIVAIGPNASNPHYGPTSSTTSYIKEGDLVLIDMWAKQNHPLAVYADITWMGYVGREIPEHISERFNILKTSIDNTIEFLNENLGKRNVQGYEVDDVARDYINKTQYGKYFTHRLGHNIGVDVSPHGPGANMDNYESHDTRHILNYTSFSLEPGIYAPDFGMRSETNVTVIDNKPVIVGGRQQEVIAIMKL